jgi:uncharacterized protein YcbK (DUF882 family)
MKSEFDTEVEGLTRRQVLRGAVLGAAFVLSPFAARAGRESPRSLDFQSIHTGESLSVVYHADGDYRGEALSLVDYQLRDHRSGEVSHIDPGLLDLLYDLKVQTGSREPFQVISGFRSPASNEMLRKRGGKVGRRSYHMKGMAIDIRLADVPGRELRELALGLKRGGVGYYQRSDFVHVDVGPVRSW